MQIQISWQPTDLDLHCLQRQGIFGFSWTRVNIRVGFVPMGHICRVNREVPLEYVNSECRDQPEHPRSLFGTFDVHLQTRFILYKIAMGSKGSDVTSGTYPFRISFQTHLRLDIMFISMTTNLHLEDYCVIGLYSYLVQSLYHCIFMFKAHYFLLKMQCFATYAK